MRNTELALEIKSKEEKSEVEWEFLKQRNILSMISEIVISEQKLDISSEYAVMRIREVLQENLD